MARTAIGRWRTPPSINLIGPNQMLLFRHD
jgi:hypothetical protein